MISASRGYARNFLIPQKLAIYGTPGNIEEHAVVQASATAAFGAHVVAAVMELVIRLLSLLICVLTLLRIKSHQLIQSLIKQKQYVD